MNRFLILSPLLAFFCFGCEQTSAQSAQESQNRRALGQERQADPNESRTESDSIPVRDDVSPLIADADNPSTDEQEDVGGEFHAFTDISFGPPEVELEAQPLGGVCAKDDDCIDEGTCNTAYLGGYCTLWCLDHEECGPEGKCFEDPLTGKDMCWKPCNTSDNCRIDQYCASGLCIPKCQEGDCNTGYQCYENGKCEPIAPVQCEPQEEICDAKDNNCDKIIDEGCGPKLALSEPIIVKDLGLVQVGGEGLSKTLKVTPSQDAISFSILILDADASGELALVYTLSAPSGEALVNISDPYESPIRVFPSIGVVTVLVPNTPSVMLEEGKYEFTIYREGESGHVWVYVLESHRMEPATSTLDANFWFVGTPGLSASTAQSNNKFQKLVLKFEEIMGSFGIIIGKTTYLDVTGTDAQTYTYVDVSNDGYGIDEHAELLVLSEDVSVTNRGVNFFFVQGFNGWGVLGKAGGIPGPPLIHGTYQSGVVISLVDYYGLKQKWGIPVTAETMCHELGHQLGLFHVTEQPGDLHDPIADTPECSNDWNGDGMVDSEECENAGGDNLMFWSVSLGTALSEGQRFVIHRNASMY